MSVRQEINEFVAAGALPSESADTQAIAEAGRLLERIVRPVTDDEAQELVAAFGDDECYGLGWTLLHLIETAPGAQQTRYLGNAENYWVARLNERVALASDITDG